MDLGAECLPELSSEFFDGLNEFLSKDSFEDLERLLYDKCIDENDVERFFLQKMKVTEENLRNSMITLLYDRGACRIYGINYNNPRPKDFKIARRMALKEKYESWKLNPL